MSNREAGLHSSDEYRLRKGLPKITDKIGRILDKIVIIPLFGDKFEFMDIQTALAFIHEVPEETPCGKLNFIRLEVQFHFLNENDYKIQFNRKQTAIDYIKLLFGDLSV